MFDTIEPFADYSFNKSHSIGYGFVAYQTAYLKANHPVEYLAALLTSVKTQQGPDRRSSSTSAASSASPVLVPDVNESVSDFSVRPRPGADGDRQARSASGCRRCATSARAWSAQIVAARDEGGPFTDFYDFCDRVDPSVLNKRTIESLIKAGAFDSLGHPRQGLLVRVRDRSSTR